MTGLTTSDVGEAARARDLVVHELAEISSSLEQAYLQLTAASLEYAAPTEDSEVPR